MNADEEVCFLDKDENSDKNRVDEIKGDGDAECEMIT
jgi:hypothetical protein